MPNKTQEYLNLAQQTAKELTRYWENWTDYLTTASRLYKYSYSGGQTMQTFEEVLTHFHSFLESATYLDVVPCCWGYVRLFNEGDPINFNAILCRTPQELYTVLANDLETEIQIGLGID